MVCPKCGKKMLVNTVRPHVSSVMPRHQREMIEKLVPKGSHWVWRVRSCAPCRFRLPTIELPIRTLRAIKRD
jgi:DNA-directed RNA polymerase subunit RPC12/RpoP